MFLPCFSIHRFFWMRSSSFWHVQLYFPLASTECSQNIQSWKWHVCGGKHTTRMMGLVMKFHIAEPFFEYIESICYIRLVVAETLFLFKVCLEHTEMNTVCSFPRYSAGNILNSFMYTPYTWKNDTILHMMGKETLEMPWKIWKNRFVPQVFVLPTNVASILKAPLTRPASSRKTTTKMPSKPCRWAPWRIRPKPWNRPHPVGKRSKFQGFKNMDAKPRWFLVPRFMAAPILGYTSTLLAGLISSSTHPFLTVATRVLYWTVETSNWSGDIQISSEVVGCCLGMCIHKNSRPPFKDANGHKRKGSSRLDEGQFFE